MSKQYLYFFCHNPQTIWYTVFAEQLMKRLGIPSICLVQGTRDRFDAKNTGKYMKVIDILQDFDPSIAELNFSENREKLAKWEQEWGSISFFRDLGQDRWFIARFSDAYAASYALHIGGHLNYLFNKWPPVALIGEKNSLAYRISYHICTVKGIPHLTLLKARHFDRRFYFEDDICWSWTKFRKLYKQYRTKGISRKLIGIAEAAYIRITKEHYRPLGRMGHFEKRGTESVYKKFSISRLRNKLQFLLYDVMRDRLKNPRALRLSEYNPIHRCLRVYRERKRKRYFDKVAHDNIDINRPYACYFLHVQPEYTVEGLGFEYQNQIELIRNIATALPANIALYVKEHTPMIGIRSITYLQELQKIPNVILISDKINSHKIIKNAKVVFSITGTVALEAVFHQIPAVLFGEVFHTAVDGITQFLNLRDDLKITLPKIIWNPRNFVSSKTNALAILAAMYESSYDGLVAPEALERLKNEKNREMLGNAFLKELQYRGVL